MSSTARIQADSGRVIMFSDARKVQVRAYRLEDNRELSGVMQPFLEKFLALRRECFQAGHGIFPLDALFFDEPHLLVKLMACATNLSAAQIEALSDEDGRKLLAAWWACNAQYFIYRLQMMDESGVERSQLAS